MADEEKLPEEDVPVPEPEAGVLFRAEMFAMNVLLGYAKVLIGVLVVVLIVALIIGQYQSWTQQNQRLIASQISDVKTELRGGLLASLPELERGPREEQTRGAFDLLSTLPDPNEEARALIQEAATQLEEVAAEATGTAQAEAWLLAAELRRIAEQPEEQRADLERATEPASGALAAVVGLNLAALDVDTENTEAALARLDAMATEIEGFGARRALRKKAALLAATGDEGAALEAYNAYEQRFPEAPDLAEVQAARAALGAGEG